MYIAINDTTTLGQIADTFSNYYPYLRMAFFKVPHQRYQSSVFGQQYGLTDTIGAIRKTHVSGIFEILPTYTVAEVERNFQLRFGIALQILHKEREQWKQTLGLDDFSLRELNEWSRNSSDEYILHEGLTYAV
jgi:hypothetical protein